MHLRPLLRRPLAAGSTALALATALAVPLVGGAPATAAFEGDYGARTVVTFADPVHTRMPVTLALPAPASGGAVTGLSASWSEPVPQGDGTLSTKQRISLDVSSCTADATCHVEGVLPTARMANGTPDVTFLVSNADGTVDLFTRRPTVQNPKPTVSFTAPDAYTALWGEVTLAADAAPSTQPGAAPLAGVRFYVDGTLSQDSPYRFDATAPYAVTLPATDIAPVLSSRVIVAVAEDTDGNLSVMPTGATGSVRRHVSVGPPPVVAAAPAHVPGASGSMQNGVDVDFRADLPDSAPARPGEPSDPYLRSVTLLLDGSPLWTTPYTSPASWNGYRAGTKQRSISGTVRVTADQGLTAGRHEVTVRITTSYDSVTDATTPILVADGVHWGHLTSGGHRVRNGYVVTAGTTHGFVLPVSAAVRGTHLLNAGLQIDGRDVMPQRVLCYDADPCPGAYTLEAGDWVAPKQPGTVTLEATAEVELESGPRTLTRTLVVQPAARLTSAVFRHRVVAGHGVRLTGRLTRLDTGEPQSGRTVVVQWRPIGGDHWRTLTTRLTDATGTIALTVRPGRSATYRLHAAEVRGTLGAGTSPARTVLLRR